MTKPRNIDNAQRKLMKSADKTSEPDVRKVYLSIAHQWRHMMAEQTEKRAALRFVADVTEPPARQLVDFLITPSFPPVPGHR
jgi:hypothetical protein